MYTYSAKPNTIEEVQTTIEHWFGASYKEVKPPCTLSRESNESRLNVFIAYSTHRDLKVEMVERCLLFQASTQGSISTSKNSWFMVLTSARRCA